MRKVAIALLLICGAVFAQQGDSFTNSKEAREVAVQRATKAAAQKAAKAVAKQGSFTDPRDGKTYKTVKIGSQTWMAENLNYDISGSKCYNNKLANCEIYGRLYDWNTAMKSCPSGWHLPSIDEWQKLVDFAGGDEIAGTDEVAGTYLKAKEGWAKNGNGTDNYGFSALPGGYNTSDNRLAGDGGYWWSSTETSTNTSNSRDMRNSYSGVGRFNSDKKYNLFSVRCVQREKAEEVTKEKARKTAAQKARKTAAQKAAKAVVKWGSFSDQRDDKTYKTVEIGSQTWMAENLNYNADGSVCYDDDESNCQKYGRLYDWNTALKVCPSGWHLPGGDEWQKLIDFAGGDEIDGIGTDEIAGTYLKAKEGWAKNGNGTDNYGFSALPGGRSLSPSLDGGSFDVGDDGYWWSASDVYKNGTCHRLISYGNERVYWSNFSDEYSLFSVRCIEGEIEHSSSGASTGDMLGGSAGGIGAKTIGGQIKLSSRDIDMGSGDGSRSKAEIMAVVNARMPGLRNVYNKYLKLKPDFSGKVTIKFTIAPGGDIISISIVSSTTGYSEFDNAVKNMVATWKWKVIKSGNTTSTIPFNFVE